MPPESPPPRTPPPEGWTLNTIAVTLGGVVLMLMPLLLWIAWSPAILLTLLGVFGLALLLVSVFGQSFLEKEWGAPAQDDASAIQRPREAPGHDRPVAQETSARARGVSGRTASVRPTTARRAS